MHIIQLATEFAPIAKAGGLGEVIVGLSRELIRIGHHVEVILPKYDFIDLKALKHVKIEVPDFRCLEKGHLHVNAMWSGEYEGISLHLLEARHPAGYFYRGKIYGCEDDVTRFLYFSRAALEYLKLRGMAIDVLHLHDWHVALASVLSRELFALPIKSIVLSIHNAAYQGKCAVWDLDYIGLKGQTYFTPEKLQDNHSLDLINILKGGLLYSDAVVAVSPTYAQEILTPEVGYGLDSTFRKIKSKLVGILNGLDLKLWNPAQDRCLAASYQAGDSYQTILHAKEKTRAVVAKRFHIASDRRPWIGSITRLVHQKGPELLEVALHRTLQLGGTFVLLGSSPLSAIRSQFEALKLKYKDKSAIFYFEYDELLAHQVYASLDFLVLPSLYEPCGLSQMIAMRYGTIPLARATGGYKDTIIDCENGNKQNGFLFPAFTSDSMLQALSRSGQLFKEKPAFMKVLIENGMRADWSWEKPAQQYVDLFQKTIKN